MEQLVIKYKLQSPSVREIKTELKLAPNETKDIDTPYPRERSLWRGFCSEGTKRQRG